MIYAEISQQRKHATAADIEIPRDPLTGTRPEIHYPATISRGLNDQMRSTVMRREPDAVMTQYLRARFTVIGPAFLGFLARLSEVVT
jgi:hypothetical protein